MGKMRTVPRQVIITLIVAIAIFFALRATIQTSVIVGPSMEPGLQAGERIFVNKVIYKLHEPERGDVIVFRPPNSPQEEYIKRLIAFPGEEVEIKEGKVYIYQNGDVLLLDEHSYVESFANYTFPKQQVPENSYFVLGDNRNSSNDSHNGWTVPYPNVVGKAWLLIWPPGEWGTISNYSLPQG